MELCRHTGIGNFISCSSYFVLVPKHWRGVCDEAGLTEVDRNLLWRRQFLNPYAFYNLTEEAKCLTVIVDNLSVN
jgi:hypothetical protein